MNFLIKDSYPSILSFSLLMAQYRQIKLRQLGLHEELQAAIDRYKQLNQLGPDLDRFLQEDIGANSIGLADPFSNIEARPFSLGQ